MEQNEGNRGEVDTSAPIESVKEAVTRFGGIGFWKPQSQVSPFHSVSFSYLILKVKSLQDSVEEEAKRLAGHLMLKERETLHILKQLQATKTRVEELKVKLQKASSTPGFILLELKQAKLNLTRATVETYNKKIQGERLALEKTRQRLSLPTELPREMAKAQVVRATNQIQHTKMRMETAEIQLVAAIKLKEAAKASEALARSEIISLSQTQTLSQGEGQDLSFQEYTSLKLKSLEAQEAAQGRVKEAMARLQETELSKTNILKRVEEATQQVKNSKTLLEEALSRAEAANNDKLKVEQALRKWRSDHGQSRKSTTRFKNPGTHVNGPTMSIGQILSQKLLLTEEYSEKSKVSLAQMLSGEKRRSIKRKKFGLGRISFLVAKPSKKKKKHSISS